VENKWRWRTGRDGGQLLVDSGYFRVEERHQGVQGKVHSSS